MLHVYNYMVIGLAITGLAALGIYIISVTGDASAAAKILRNGVEVPRVLLATCTLRRSATRSSLARSNGPSSSLR
jgi:FtsH-binding integral membrane protein